MNAKKLHLITIFLLMAMGISTAVYPLRQGD